MTLIRRPVLPLLLPNLWVSFLQAVLFVTLPLRSPPRTPTTDNVRMPYPCLQSVAVLRVGGYNVGLQSPNDLFSREVAHQKAAQPPLYNRTLAVVANDFPHVKVKVQK